VYDVPNAPTTVETGSGQRVVGRTLPFGWKADAYGEQQIGPEQFIWWGQDRVIYAKNVRDEPRGSFEYGKGTTKTALIRTDVDHDVIPQDVYSGIYAIFSRNLISGETETLVSASPGGASRPELSHDGRTLAFVRRVRDKEVLALRWVQSFALKGRVVDAV
jgi:hypothetical protein